MKRKYFLIVSNMRSGSTLLETMLGALDGVFSDREVKWKRAVVEPVHLLVSEETSDLQRLFEQELAAGDAQLVGSKLVIDPFNFSEQAQIHLRTIIPDDWYVIHLTRCYRGIFLSRHRGAEHLRNTSGAPIKGPRLQEVLSTKQISNEGSVAIGYVDRVACYRELTAYLSNDLWISSLAERRAHYFQIDYSDIFTRFRELVEFMRLDSSRPDVAAAIASPPLQKLPAIPAERLVANLDELESVFDATESLRHLLILDHPILRSFLPSWQEYQARGDARLAEGDFVGATGDYTAALKGSPPNAALLYLRGQSRLRNRDTGGALDDFMSGLTLDPGNELLISMVKQAKKSTSAASVPIHLVTQLWGKPFVQLYLDVVLDSIISDGNLPTLSLFQNVVYEIYTTREDRKMINHHPEFARAKEKVGSFVHFRFVEIEVSQRQPHAIMSDCHRKAIVEAEAKDAAIVFLQPDVIVGDGTLRTVRNKLIEGKRLVMAPGLRTIREKMAVKYREYADCRPRSVRRLVTLACENLHPISRALVWGKDGRINQYCSHLYWLIGDTSLYARCAGMHPLMVYPREKRSGFEGTIDWDYPYRACPDEKDWFVASSSDEICLIELSELSKFEGTETWVPATPYALANFLSIGSRKPEHVSLLSRDYTFKGDGFNDQAWIAVHGQAEETIKQAKLLLSSAAYQERGTKRLNAGDYPGAISDYSAVLQGSPPNEAIFFLRGTARLKLKEFRGAIKDFEIGLGLSPANGPLQELKRLAHRGLGQACDTEGDFDAADVEYTSAMDGAAIDPVLYFLRGRARLRLAAYKGAIEDFEVALTVDPDNAPLRELLLVAENKQRQSQDAPS